MDQVRDIYAEVRELDRRNLISIEWLKRWVVSLITVFIIFFYVWNRIFADMKDDHIPKALLPIQLQGSSYVIQSEAEGRSLHTREINFVIFACSTTAVPSEDGNNKRIVFDAVRTMKSAALFSKRVIHFHIFTEDSLFQALVKEVDQWPYSIKHRVTFKFHSALFPEATFLDSMQTNVTSSFRSSCDLSVLFIPVVVKNLDFAVYVKHGSLFLSSVDDLWSNLQDYKEENALSLPLVSQNSFCKTSLRSRNQNPAVDDVFDSTILVFDTYRLQQSVFSIPITKRDKQTLDRQSLPININDYDMVNMTWNTHMILSIYKLFKDIIREPSKDILNIIAYFNPSKIYTLPCEWNFKSLGCFEPFSCSASKLVVSDFNALRSEIQSSAFGKLGKIIDDTNFSKYSNHSFWLDINALKSTMYREWPVHNLCSLRNVDTFENTARTIE